MKRRGFTLIELLVVISIISLLSSVVLASLDSARAKARDARRKADLRNIATALELHRSDVGTYCVSAYGAGGYGWFNHQYYSGSLGSVGEGLRNLGYTSSEIIDPTGERAYDSGTQSGYLIVCSVDRYTLWANLERPTAQDRATQDSCYFSDYDNYWSGFPAADRSNYCVSN